MENQFTLLVSKVLAGEASDEDKKLLQQMLLDSPEHSLLYNQMKEYWNADVKLTSNVANEDFEEKLLSQLSFEPSIQRSVFRKLYVRFASAAAILFFVATCALTYLLMVSPRQLYTYSAQLTPADYILADGTKVKLNKNSSITFKSDYGDSRRDVELKGEAFFKVTKDKSRPFSVETLGTRTEVLGTSFNVKSLPETGLVITTLVTGSVHFNAKRCDVLLHPGEEIVYNTFFNKYTFQSTDLQYNTAWTSGRINYSGIRFGDLLVKLEHIFKLKITISDQQIANRIVSVSILTEEPVADVLSAFQKELGFKFTMDSTQISIIRKN